jgi:hypothetical protein
VPEELAKCAHEKLTKALAARFAYAEWTMLQGRKQRYVVGLLAFATSSCFVGYDSRWGQQTQAQKHLAAHATPHELHGQTSGLSALRPRRALKLRVYATPRYAASVIDWQKQFGTLLECANSVFVPDFGVALEAAEMRSFRPRADEEKLDGVLAELAQADAAEDVDWVVGLAPAVPRFAVSADDLGLAQVVGQHFVMRAMSDPHEYEAIQSGLSKLPESERLKLYSVRKQHKLCSVFLHELAHSLGVPHELPSASLLNPRYHPEASGFSDEATDIIQRSLSYRALPSHALLDVDFARNLQALLQAPNADWEPGSRDQELASIAPFAQSSAPLAQSGRPLSPQPAGATRRSATALGITSPSTQEQLAATPSSPPVEGLGAAEQRDYDRARAELSAGRASSARDLAAPLLAAHPNSVELQSLRCDIAMGIGGDWETISAACQGLSPLGH